MSLIKNTFKLEKPDFEKRFKELEESYNKAEINETKINLNEIVGKYFNSEVNTTYEIVIKEKKLVATHDRNKNIELTPFQKDVLL